MSQYIPKSALVTEIERRIKSILEMAHPNNYDIAALQLYKGLLSFINTIEAKEVDLDDKDEWKNTGGFGSTWDPDSPDYCPD